MLTIFYSIKGDDKMHIFSSDNNTYTHIYIYKTLKFLLLNQ